MRNISITTGTRDMEKVKADAYIYLAVLIVGLGARAARENVLEGFVMDLIVVGLCTFVMLWSWRSIGK